MSDNKITQEDLMKARDKARKKIQANVVTGDIVEAQLLSEEELEEKEKEEE